MQGKKKLYMLQWSHGFVFSKKSVLLLLMSLIIIKLYRSKAVYKAFYKLQLTFPANFMTIIISLEKHFSTHCFTVT